MLCDQKLQNGNGSLQKLKSSIKSQVPNQDDNYLKSGLQEKFSSMKKAISQSIYFNYFIDYQVTLPCLNCYLSLYNYSSFLIGGILFQLVQTPFCILKMIGFLTIILFLLTGLRMKETDLSNLNSSKASSQGKNLVSHVSVYANHF